MSAVRATLADEAAERRILLVQGEYRVSEATDVVFNTLLGSCVAACLYDPVGRVGGMNHFLLPDGAGTGGAGTGGVGVGSQDSVRFGAHCMELLVNGLLGLGARRDRLRGKLFGGARMMQGLTDIGSKNVAFAEAYLAREGITYEGGSLGGEHARRVQFWPASGRARQMMAAHGAESVFETERRRTAHRAAAAAGAVELF